MGWVFSDDFAKIEAALLAETRVAVDATATAVLDKSLAIVPVDTGALKASGHVVRPGDAEFDLTANPGIVADEIMYDAHYSVYVHYGYFNVRAGRFMAPRPFLDNPLLAGEPTLIAFGDAAMQRAFDAEKT